MFFWLSKTLGFFSVPSNIILVLTVAGLLLMATRFARFGRRLVVLGVVLLALAGLSPIGNALILPLEQRFPSAASLTNAPDGIVVLGGAIGPALSRARGEAALNESAERVIVVAELARRYPRARIVYSGGDPSLLDRGPGEANFALPLFENFGIPRDRITVEDKSLNTAENAAFTKAMVGPNPGERWLLVTSAHHMPRAVGCFRRVGFDVVAYPVDWRTRGAIDLMFPFATVAAGLARTDVAIKEWVGLLVYWLTGKTSELLPGPA
jgi:uncharacterized SAM-binding protein YcdF (DUF218 family)